MACAHLAAHHRVELTTMAPSISMKRSRVRPGVTIAGLAAALSAAQPAMADSQVVLGRAEAPLNGPWAFQFGHDPRWASPGFDDGHWERVDLTPAPGARDGDVGIPGYVPGWTARGHPGRWGHAWYRLRVRWSAPGGAAPVLVGPSLVDGAYEIFSNGRRIGGIGDFSAKPPRAFATRPRLYRVPGEASTGSAVIAIHVYLPEDLAREDEVGGIHVAPILAEPTAGTARHLSQWWQTFWGYVVDVIEPIALLVLALYALALRRFFGADPFLPALALALTAIAALRLNQPLFFWTEIESLGAFVIARHVVLEPLATSLWIVASGRVGGRRGRRAEGAALVLGLLAGITSFPGITAASAHVFARLGLLVLFARSVIQVARNQRSNLSALSAVLLVAVALFSEELWAIGIPGSWFPLGVGVSRSQFALALSIPLLAALLYCRVPAPSARTPSHSLSPPPTPGDVVA